MKKFYSKKIAFFYGQILPHLTRIGVGGGSDNLLLGRQKIRTTASSTVSELIRLQGPLTSALAPNGFSAPPNTPDCAYDMSTRLRRLGHAQPGSSHFQHAFSFFTKYHGALKGVPGTLRCSNPPSWTPIGRLGAALAIRKSFRALVRRGRSKIDYFLGHFCDICNFCFFRGHPKNLYRELYRRATNPIFRFFFGSG